ncbi:MAG: type III-A CRISPR-associated RAMP protein Csm5 [candidate division WOR-3 bacterium]
MKLKIKILSPVNIGSGETKTKIDYIIENGKVHFINEDLFNDLICQDKLDKQFINWIQNGGNDISQFLVKYPAVKEKIITNPLYSLPVKETPKNEVHLHIKDSKNNFYIPGSSIKGAIRTALLYNALKNTKLDRNIFEGILKVDLKKRGNQVAMELEKLMFRAGVRKNDRVIYNDAKYDLLRFIHISDAFPISAEYSILPIITYSDDDKEIIRIYAEVIERGEFICDFNIDVSTLLKLKNSNEENEWIGFKEKFKRVFGVDLSSISEKNYEETKNLIIKNILKKCETFSNDVKDTQSKLKISYNQIPISEGVINIGLGGGYRKKTVGTIIESYTDIFKKLRLKFELGKLRYKVLCKKCNKKFGTFEGSKTKNFLKMPKFKIIKYEDCPKAEPDQKKHILIKKPIETISPFPKTTEIVVKDDNTTSHMGWVKLEK